MSGDTVCWIIKIMSDEDDGTKNHFYYNQIIHNKLSNLFGDLSKEFGRVTFYAEDMLYGRLINVRKS